MNDTDTSLTLIDVDGGIWFLTINQGIEFVTDEHGECFTRKFIEDHVGPLVTA